MLRHFQSAPMASPRAMLVSQRIETLVTEMDRLLSDSAERSAGFRKLLEARDCLLRAAREEETT